MSTKVILHYAASRVLTTTGDVEGIAAEHVVPWLGRFLDGGKITYADGTGAPGYGPVIWPTGVRTGVQPAAGDEPDAPKGAD